MAIGLLVSVGLMVSVYDAPSGRANDGPLTFVMGPATHVQVTIPTPHGLPRIPSFDFGRPERIWNMPDALGEISGVASATDSVLLAVEDEHGIVYRLEAVSGVVIGKTEFAPRGDFEDIEVIEGSAWILESDGTLYEVSLDAGQRSDARRHRTGLSRRYDLEGLTVDPLSGWLWVAAKEPGRKEFDGLRSVFAFDPATGTTLEGAVMTISVGDVERRRRPATFFERLRRLWTPSADHRFKPSALAFYGNGRILAVVSSVDPVVAWIDRSGRVLRVDPIPIAVLPQPEGITVTSGGCLLLASEGAGGSGRIARFCPLVE